ncbi:unnamed protein product [Symbiodinium sp. CCMP2592]|nr:unnamed protein product [Symbiodinium sp. CCMP2592]
MVGKKAPQTNRITYLQRLLGPDAPRQLCPAERTKMSRELEQLKQRREEGIRTRRHVSSEADRIIASGQASSEMVAVEVRQGTATLEQRFDRLDRRLDAVIGPSESSENLRLMAKAAAKREREDAKELRILHEGLLEDGDQVLGGVVIKPGGEELVDGCRDLDAVIVWGGMRCRLVRLGPDGVVLLHLLAPVELAQLKKHHSTAMRGFVIEAISYTDLRWKDQKQPVLLSSDRRLPKAASIRVALQKGTRVLELFPVKAEREPPAKRRALSEKGDVQEVEKPVLVDQAAGSEAPAHGDRRGGAGRGARCVVETLEEQIEKPLAPDTDAGSTAAPGTEAPFTPEMPEEAPASPKEPEELWEIEHGGSTIRFAFLRFTVFNYRKYAVGRPVDPKQELPSWYLNHELFEEYDARARSLGARGADGEGAQCGAARDGGAGGANREGAQLVTEEPAEPAEKEHEEPPAEVPEAQRAEEPAPEIPDTTAQEPTAEIQNAAGEADDVEIVEGLRVRRVEDGWLELAARTLAEYAEDLKLKWGGDKWAAELFEINKVTGKLYQRKGRRSVHPDETRVPQEMELPIASELIVSFLAAPADVQQQSQRAGERSIRHVPGGQSAFEGYETEDEIEPAFGSCAKDLSALAAAARCFGSTQGPLEMLKAVADGQVEAAREAYEQYSEFYHTWDENMGTDGAPCSPGYLLWVTLRDRRPWDVLSPYQVAQRVFAARPDEISDEPLEP